MKRETTPSSRRRAYLEWVEEQIETFKESVSRTELLAIADEVVRELRVSESGQYQWTELLLAEAVDRKIFKMLKLPSYRSWAASHPARVTRERRTTEDEQKDVPPPLPEAASF